jgi:lipoyl(octanoyl) transferase
MNKTVTFIDLGLKDYKEVWDFQEELFAKTLKAKRENKETSNSLIFCEHPHVFTLGKSGSDKNLLATEQWLTMAKATFYKINRGGDITYHGPGQTVGYPILDLEQFGMGIHDYIFALEDIIIRTLKDFSIISERLEGSTGVWLDTDNPLNVRKICAIGVRASRYVTMHGFALNVTSDLNYFQKIVPCGIPDKKVTSMQVELGDVDIKKVNATILKHFADVFGAEIVY